MAEARNIDFERLFKVLLIRATVLLRGEERSVDMGTSAKDLSGETLEAFFDSPNRLGWSEKKGPLENFLCGVLANKAKTHRRRDRKVAGSFDDKERSFPVISGERTPEEKAQSKELEEKLCAAVGDDQDLRDLIAAVEWTTGGHCVNKELAEYLGKTAPEIVNLKRRLMNNQRVLELLGIYGKG